MPKHDLLVFDDDERLNLELRAEYAGRALRDLPAALGRSMSPDEIERLGVESWSVFGFSSRSAFLEHVARRPAADWAFALIDLEGRDTSMLGARIIRVVREHDLLRPRCMPLALTIHVDPAIAVGLRDLAFAHVQMGGSAAVDRIVDALATLLTRNRHPTATEPDCVAFPEMAPLAEWGRTFRARFEREFGFPLMSGDDLILRNIYAQIDDKITNARLAQVPGTRRTKGVSGFKQEVTKRGRMSTATATRKLREFVIAAGRRSLDDPVNPADIEGTQAAWITPAIRERAYLPRRYTPAMDEFFETYHRRMHGVSNHNAVGREQAYQHARERAGRHLDDGPRRIDHAILTLRDTADEHLPPRA